jgi:hypothetical protein
MSHIDWCRALDARAAMLDYAAREPIHGPAVARFPLNREDLEFLRAMDKAFSASTAGSEDRQANG